MLQGKEEQKEGINYMSRNLCVLWAAGIAGASHREAYKGRRDNIVRFY